MRLNHSRVAGCVLLLLSATARAQLQVEVTRGVSDPVPVAVVPFARAGAMEGDVDVAAIVERDLASSGRFRGIDRAAMPARPQQVSDVSPTAWRAARADYVVVGRVTASGSADVMLHLDRKSVV